MRVSVVIPTYNAAAHLAEAIASVRTQTRPVAEVIVVDDCSADGSAELAAALGATTRTTGRNSGPSAARNLGWRTATGDVVMFLDADDYWEPSHVATLVDLLERHPEVELVFSRVRTFGGRDDVTQAVLPDATPTWAMHELLLRNIVPQIAVAVRRDALAAVGGYDERFRYSEDYHLWLRLARRAPFACSHRVTAHYRVHAGQATAAAVKVLRGCWDVRAEFLAELRRDAAPDEVARVEAQLRAGYEADLQSVWHVADADQLHAALALHDRVPGGAAIRDRWARRARLLWHPWLAAKYVWSRTPAPLVRGVRRLRRVTR